MDNSLAVHIDQSRGNVSQLQWSCGHQRQGKVRVADETRTSLSRSALVLFSTYSLMLPFAIHSDTITSRSFVIVTPNSGNTFG